MPRPVRLVHTGALSDVAEYAYAATVDPPVRWIHLAGACPLDEDGRTVAPGDVAAQAATVMDNLEAALAAAGAQLRDVAKTTVYVASEHQSDLVTAWELVRDRFGDHDPPATLLGVTVLGYDDQLVEVDAVAAVTWRDGEEPGRHDATELQPAVGVTERQPAVDATERQPTVSVADATPPR